MKKPRLLNLAAGVSLLLAIVIVALWVRSHGHDDTIDRVLQTSDEIRDCQLGSSGGYLSLAFVRMPHKGRPAAPSYMYQDWARINAGYLGADLWFPLRPVEYLDFPPSPKSMGLRRFLIAYWFLLPLTLVLPAIAIVRHRRRRRRERADAGLCPTCGYDLRATPDRCPECGTVPASS